MCAAFGMRRTAQHQRRICEPHAAFGRAIVDAVERGATNVVATDQFKSAAAGSEQRGTSDIAGDGRVWQVAPYQLVVSSEPDVSSTALYAATGTSPPDPTGMIACPQPCNVNYAPAYSLYVQRATRYAASWDSAEANFDYLVQYEFENQILSALGYDMRWR